ncbi:MAG: sugar transporter [Bacteroidales bacterium]|nr:sugar transporter [Bacteroidales bacterium]
MKIKEWLPVLTLTLAAFVFNTSEFVPIGLLSDIALDLHVTEAKAGVLISTYAWAVALASLPLMTLFSKTEYRALLRAVVGVFTLSHALSAIADSYAMLMASRMGVAFSHAIFWSVANPLAIKVAPEGRGPLAMSLIMTGTSLAQVLGLPLGRIIGLALGWRLTFLCMGAIALAVLIILATLFPKVENETKFSARDLPLILRNRRLSAIYIIIILLVTGHFTAYSYIEPFLLGVAGFPQMRVTVAIMLFGFAGVIASILFSRFYPHNLKLLALFAAGGIATSLFLARPISSHVSAILALCIFWGICVSMVNLVFQAELIATEKKATTVAMALYSSLFNIGIGTGAFVGGRVSESLGIGCIGVCGAFMALAGTIAAFLYIRSAGNTPLPDSIR